MEIIKKTINNNKYTFVCETWETSRAWGHKVTMFRNDSEYTTQKVTYYNRTWESYLYQSCILKCVNTVIEEESKHFIQLYKNDFNRKRLTQNEKDLIINNNALIEELKELKKTL